ncbi:hypothetical protein KKG81_12995 [bacterium]|nr:hypothetical protein [bacterium]
MEYNDDEEQMSEEKSYTDLKESIKNILRDLNNPITYANAEQIIYRVISAGELIEGHISSALYTEKIKRKEFNEFKKRKSVSRMISENKVCPIELINTLTDSRIHLKEAYDWDRTQLEMYKKILPKLKEALGAIKGYDIEKEVTKGFEERQKSWMDLTKDLVTVKFKQLEEDIIKIKDRQTIDIEKIKDMIIEMKTYEFKKHQLSFDDIPKKIEKKKAKISTNIIKDLDDSDDNDDNDEEAQEDVGGSSNDSICQYCGIDLKQSYLKKVHEGMCKRNPEVKK